MRCANKPAYRCNRPARSRQKGFTLVELVMVIVIGGILSIGSVQFISQATQGYSDAADRQQLATIGWIASEKISRELRNSLPNSIRINNNTGTDGSCIEFVPIIGGSHYLTLPGGLTPTSFTAVASGFSSAPSDSRAAVYPSTTNDVYGKSNPGELSTSKISTISTASDVDTITLDSSFTFATDSPERRFYIVQDPVMYCVESSRLNRYSQYGYETSFSKPTSGAQVVVDKVSKGTFDVAPATLTRNAVVTLHFTLINGATHTVDQEVQIRNVP